MWMWSQLKNASPQPCPTEGYEQSLFTVQHSPRYWKRLVRRAAEHSILQRRRVHHVCRFHREALPLLWQLTWRPRPEAATEPVCPAAWDRHFGSMQCQKMCLNAAGEAAHMNHVHGQVAGVCFLFDTTSCGACLKEFHTMQKIKAHLHYSARCRTILLSRNLQCPPICRHWLSSRSSSHRNT